MTRLLLVHGVACGLFLAAPALSQSSPELTPKDIEEAIAWGRSGDPSPYLLHHAEPAGGVNSGIVGAVYTPFLRVALAARAARERGEDLAPLDVNAAWIEPTALVAFRWYCCVDSEHGTNSADWDPRKPPTDYRIAAPGDRVANSFAKPWSRVTVSPLWVKPGTSTLASFGADLPFKDLVLVAAYPLNALSSGSDFIIYRELPTQSGGAVGGLIGRVAPEDLKRWR